MELPAMLGDGVLSAPVLRDGANRDAVHVLQRRWV